MSETVHEVNRQVSEEEQMLWQEFRDWLETSEYEYISVTDVATDHVGVHETRSRQIVSTWENEGLVRSGAAGSYDKAALTEYGSQVDEIESIITSGESWR